MDFAENYALCQQDECQSTHWNNDQVTIHPIVNYYQDDDAIITHEVVYIPSDLQHDSHFVRACEEDLVAFLAKETDIEFSSWVQYTNGCPA